MFNALATDLMGVGFSAGQANQIGYAIRSVTAAGTTQGAGAAVGKGVNEVALVTTSSTDYAVTISSGLAVGKGVLVTNIAASIYACSIFPPTSGTIDGGSANAAIVLNGGESAYVYRVSTTAFRSWRLPRPGMVPASVTGVGTAQGGSSPTISANSSNLLTTAVGQTAVTVDSAMPIGAQLEVFTITATAGLVFPPSGCTINQGSANASFSVAQNKGIILRRMSATAFNAILSA